MDAPVRVRLSWAWVLRESTDEEPFVGLVGSPLTSAVPVFNEVNEVVGVTLAFEAQEGDAQPMGGRDRHVAQVSGSVRSCRAAFIMRAKDKDPKCQAGWSSDSSSGPAEMAPNGRRRVRRPSVGQ